MPSSSRPSSLLYVLAVLLPGVGGGTARAADAAAPPAVPARPATNPLSPPEIVKPVIPGKAELADSAFKKLDPTGKGYVTLEDTKGLAGFEQVFRVADTDHTGKLDLTQFREAWADYSGYRDNQ